MIRLKELREERQISQTALALIIGTTQTNIYRWENGINEISSGYLLKLANYFGVTTDELLDRQNYATGIIEVAGDGLSEDEEQLLFVYRKLNHKNKSQSLGFMKGLYSNQ